MTLQEAKDKIAQNRGRNNWRQMEEGSVYGIGMNKYYDEAAELYARSKWDEACEAQQRLIIDTILRKTEAKENKSQEHVDHLQLFAKYWDNNLAPKPEFKP